MGAMANYVTKQDLLEFEEKIKEQHEIRIQMISGHYSDVLKSNLDLKEKVCSSNRVMNEKLDTLIDQIQPILDAQRVVISLHAFLKWLGLPFTVVGLAVWWAWNKL